MKKIVWITFLLISLVIISTAIYSEIKTQNDLESTIYHRQLMEKILSSDGTGYHLKEPESDGIGSVIAQKFGKGVTNPFFFIPFLCAIVLVGRYKIYPALRDEGADWVSHRIHDLRHIRGKVNLPQKIIIGVFVPVVIFMLTYAVLYNLADKYPFRDFAETWWGWLISFSLTGVFEMYLFKDAE